MLHAQALALLTALDAECTARCADPVPSLTLEVDDAADRAVVLGWSQGPYAYGLRIHDPDAVSPVPGMSVADLAVELRL